MLYFFAISLYNLSSSLTLLLQKGKIRRQEGTREKDLTTCFFSRIVLMATLTKSLGGKILFSFSFVVANHIPTSNWVTCILHLYIWREKKKIILLCLSLSFSHSFSLNTAFFFSFGDAMSCFSFYGMRACLILSVSTFCVLFSSHPHHQNPAKFIQKNKTSVRETFFFLRNKKERSTKNLFLFLHSFSPD